MRKYTRKIEIETILDIASFIPGDHAFDNVQGLLIVRDAHLCINLFDFTLKFGIFF